MTGLHRKALFAVLCLAALFSLLAIPAAAADVPTYTTSREGVEMIVEFEGFDEKRYYDYSHYTIGYGTMYSTFVRLFPEAVEGKNPDEVVITREQGWAVLQEELRADEQTVNRFLQSNNVVINQHQFDALVSLTYSVGGIWTYDKNSDGTWYRIKQILLDGPSSWTEELVQDAFGRINKAGGVVKQSLVRRRSIEAAWFLTPVTEAEEAPAEAQAPAPAPQEPSAPESVEATQVFSDVATDKWYYGYVMEAYRKGLMKGDGFGSFMPEDNLTRAQMLQVLANYSGDDLKGFAWDSCLDVTADKWYAPAVAWAVSRDLIHVDSAGYFYPEEEIDREEMCVLLARFLSRYGVPEVRSAAEFRDADRMSYAGLEAVRYCSARGLVDGVGDNLFDPAGKVSRGQIAKILLGMTALFS